MRESKTDVEADDKDEEGRAEKNSNESETNPDARPPLEEEQPVCHC